MNFKADSFIYDGKTSEEMGVLLVDTKSNGILMDYGIGWKEDLKMESSGNGKRFFSTKRGSSDRGKIILEITFATEEGGLYRWDIEDELRVTDWLAQDEFKEFISPDYPEYKWYLRCIGSSKRYTSDKMGIIEFEFVSYFKYPVKEVVLEKEIDGEEILNVRCGNHAMTKKIKPLIEITSEKDCIFSFENLTTRANEFTIETKAGEKIDVDTELYIVSNRGENLFSRVNREWLTFVKGTNLVKVKGKGKVKFICTMEVRI